MNQSLKPSVLSALVLAFSGFGDSLLYIVLPIYALQLNIPVVWIGILLSINRLVRLVANQLFSWLFARFGFKRITILAAIFAMLSTLSYGLASGIMMWILARVLWGFCYSALRISAAGYSLENKRRGFSLGISSGLQELGPVIALVTGPFILTYTDISTTFFIFSAASATAIAIAFYLPELKPSGYKYKFQVSITPSPLNMLTFLLSFFVQGILILSVSRLVTEPGLSVVALAGVAGLYLAYRRVCAIFITPLSGILADKYRIDKVYLASVFFTIAGLLLIAAGSIKTGIITTFTFYSIVNAMAPGNAVAGNTDHHLKSLALNNTWSDIGAATGVLLAGFLLPLTSFSVTFYFATFILLAASIIYSKNTFLKTKAFYNENR